MKIRDGQDIMVQTSLTGPVWKWFWLESHQTALFLAAWSSHAFPLAQAISRALQGGVSQTWSLMLLSCGDLRFGFSLGIWSIS